MSVNKFPVVLLMGMLLMTELVFMILGWNGYVSYRQTKDNQIRNLRLQEVRGAILHLDEVLTMSARMAAATGDLQWEKRYRDFEPMLDTYIKESIALSSEASTDKATAQTDAANLALVEMENQAFTLVRAGRRSEAWKVLFQPRYQREKQVYAEGMARLDERLKSYVHQNIKSELRRAVWSTALVIAVLLTFGAAWSYILKIVNQWRLMLQKNVANLDQLVADKTRELVKANTDLSEEMMKQAILKDIVARNEKLSAMGQLAAGIAHEINNPLGVISGFAESALRKVQKGDLLYMPLESIQREAVRCKTLVQDLLTFSRTSQTERVPLNLNQTVDGALSLITAKARMTQVKIQRDFGANLPAFSGNANQIQQILINLATNAIDAMKGAGTLTIKTYLLTEGPLSWICLSVSDTGSGIPQEVLPHIFEPFYTTKPQGQGTGLGLALVHGIVQKHSAMIDVKSDPGHTEFLIKLPVRTGQERRADARTDKGPFYGQQKVA